MIDRYNITKLATYLQKARRRANVANDIFSTQKRSANCKGPMSGQSNVLVLRFCHCLCNNNNSGITSNLITQTELENRMLIITKAFEKDLVLDLAKLNAEAHKE